MLKVILSHVDVYIIARICCERNGLCLGQRRSKIALWPEAHGADMAGHNPRRNQTVTDARPEAVLKPGPNVAMVGARILVDMVIDVAMHTPHRS